MFKWLVPGALVASVLACAAYDYAARQRIETRRQDLQTRRAELATLRAIDAELARYREQRSEFEARVDAVNMLKQSQIGGYRAVARLATAQHDLSPIESVAVTPAGGLVLNGTGSQEAIARLTRHFEGAKVRRSGDAFTIEVSP